ncbi:aspartate carbamoyltransferase catalytic subunit [Microlunatus sp. Y2014]|uniref:aspartate carbamoyltransferase catalytic subunit n=1 Tax=Microlunatus sp. Y2014 TaxID=3418488 RepID=UPI003DA7587A
MTRHLLSAADLDPTEVTAVLDLAEEMAQVQGRPVKKLPALRGRTVVNLFFEDSTRTRSSFELAGKWLSADVINISAKGSSVSKGESLRDTVQTVAAMGVDALVIRHHASGAPLQATGWIDAHVINAGDGTHEHPTQALLDAFTMRRHFRGQSGAPVATDGSVGTPGSQPDNDFAGRTVVIVGDLTHSRVVRSNVLLLSRLGAEVVLVAPPTLLPSGVSSWPVTVSTDFDEVLPQADIVMMLRVQRERMSGGYFPTPREYTVGYGLTRDRLARLADGAAICHPGPMNRGLEISADAADGAASLVLDQVAAGVAVRMGVLYNLLGGTDDTGTAARADRAGTPTTNGSGAPR